MIPIQSFFSILQPANLEQMALRYELDQAHSARLSGPSVFLCLLNGLLNHPSLTLRLLEETYRQQTGQTADHSSFGKALARMNPAYFADLHAALYARVAPQATPGEQKALRLRRVDATTVTLSAKLLAFGLWGGTSKSGRSRRHVKSVVELREDGFPQLLHLCREPSEAADSVALGQTMRDHTQAGDLWLFDKGVHGRARLLALHQANAFWITPKSSQTVAITRTLWEADTAVPDAAPRPGDPDFVVCQVVTGVFSNTHQAQNAQWAQMPLVIVSGWRWDARRQQWQPLSVMSNLPLSEDGLKAGPYTFAELADVYRQRWEIEVCFKFLKQHLSYAHLTSRCENGIRIMIYMSLIAALLLLWYQRQTGIDRGWRSVKFWLAEEVRHWTQQILASPVGIPDG